MTERKPIPEHPDTVLRNQIEQAGYDDGLGLAQHVVDDLVWTLERIAQRESAYSVVSRKALADFKRYLNGDVG